LVELGVNFNGNTSMEELCSRARTAERFVDCIWVGEHRPLVHPFPLLVLLAECTAEAKIGTAILSAMTNRCFHIARAFATLKEVYGERFVAGIAPGDRHGLKVECVASRRVLSRLEKCISLISKEVPVLVGGSGPKVIELGSEKSHGVILNYAHPEFVRWALDHMKKRTYVACIAPALVLPDDENLDELLAAAAVIAAGANQVFLEEMGLVEKVAEVRRAAERGRVGEHRDFLLEHFTISGSLEEVVERIQELAGLGVDQVILGSPFVISRQFEKIINSISERLSA